MSEETRAKQLELLQRAVNGLSEHFDAVQIVASTLESDGGTTFAYWGSGNLYARHGMVEVFIARSKMMLVNSKIDEAPEN